MTEAKKMTPEELARQKRAEQQLSELDEAREKTAVPIQFSAEPLTEGSVATPFEALAMDFPESFVQKFTLNGKIHEWHCTRKSHFDIFPDSEEEDEVNMRVLYRDAIQLITSVVYDPPEAANPEALKRLPVSLVTRISRGIQDEIMPRYTEDDLDG